MTAKLKFVQPRAAEPSKPKILIFGKPGVGKTWGALDFPNVAYIDTEGGADLKHYTDKLEKSGGVYFGPDQGSLDYNAVIEQLQALATQEHPYKTVVIDSFTKLFLTTIANEAQRLEDAGKKNEFGSDKKPAMALTRRLVSWLTRLDMNVILVCHEKPMWGSDAQGNRTEIGVTFDGWDKLEYELHLCLNIIKAGANRSARVRKSRLLGFPDGELFPWSYAEFSQRYGKDVIERSTQKMSLATSEQVEEVSRLLSIVKVADDYLEKCLTKTGATAIAEFTEEQAAKMINDLKGKLK